MNTYVVLLKFTFKDGSESHHLTVRTEAENEDHALRSIAEHDFSDRAWFLKSMQRMVVQIKPLDEVYRVESAKAAPKPRRGPAGGPKRRRRRRVPA